MKDTSLSIYPRRRDTLARPLSLLHKPGIRCKFKLFLKKLSMNQVKKTTTKNLNRSQVLVSDRTLELDKPPSSQLSLEMNDARALREFSSDDGPPETPAATGPTAEKRRLRVDAKSSGARSPGVDRKSVV